MLNSLTRSRKTVLIGIVALLFLILAPSLALASSPDLQATDADQPCALCHWSEAAEWEQSHHAAQNVACESCHGEYVEGHPEEGVMKLTVDAAQCQACHTNTHQQWQDSLHAQAGVNCINCHTPHSQTTRLQSEQLCCSCHADGFDSSCGHTAHNVAGVTCVDCHVSLPGGGAEEVAAGHAFTAVPAQLCLNCHSDSLHDPATVTTNDKAAKNQLAILTTQTTELSTEVDTLEKQNTNLQVLALVLLGLGLGAGIVIGLVFMLVFSYISRPKEPVS